MAWRVAFYEVLAVGAPGPKDFDDHWSFSFGDAVKAAPALCRMTSSVFGGIAARNRADGAAVVLEERISVGDPGCRVVVHLCAPPEEVAPLLPQTAPTPDAAMRTLSPFLKPSGLLFHRRGRVNVIRANVSLEDGAHRVGARRRGGRDHGGRQLL